MNVLVACEESQVVCKAFRARGHNAFSCDIIECSGGHPEWHIRWDALSLINIIQEYKPFLPSNTGAYSRGGGGSRGVAHDAKTASVTFSGIAEAMAEQWG